MKQRTNPPPLPGRKPSRFQPPGVVVLAASLVIAAFVVMMVLEACKPTRPAPPTPDRPAPPREAPERPTRRLSIAERVKGTGPDLKASTQPRRLAEYFREGNKGAIHYTGGNAERSVSSSMRAGIIKRDGNACVLCGARSVPFEVDHMRALMNGGGNQPTNLATLCVPCHLEKSAADRSLKRQREKRVRDKDVSPEKDGDRK